MTQKTKKILITVPEELCRKFKAVCALKGVTHNSVLTSFIIKFVKKAYSDPKTERFFLKETPQNENQ